jgi:NAD(P)-dependent dehydrogenase (short-subunit alcohol dehydrogenase family)
VGLTTEVYTRVESPLICYGVLNLKTAVVTGAAQGLGQVTASLLARLGFHMVLVDIKEMGQSCARVRSHDPEVRAYTGDVSSEAFVREFAQTMAKDYGAVDVLVNNAGISCIAPAESTTADQWQRVMAVNLLGPFLLCRYLGAHMLERRSGSIVNVASVAGLAGIALRSAYNASKHGLIGLTRTLAAEWGARGVRVNAVCPAWIKTEMDEVDQRSGAYSDEDIVARIPMGRFASAEDVAQAIAFLADADLSAFVNGASLPVDGGWTTDAGWERLRAATRP